MHNRRASSKVGHTHVERLLIFSACAKPDVSERPSRPIREAEKPCPVYGLVTARRIDDYVLKITNARGFVKILRHSLRPLGEDLKYVLRTKRHYREHLVDEIERHILVKQIAHRIHKYPPRRLPMKRVRQCLLDQFDLPIPLARIVDHVQVCVL